MAFFTRDFPKLLAFGASALLACAMVGDAAAIDRSPFPGRSFSDGSAGYGAASVGYGAERQYYGAENISRRRYGGIDPIGGYGGAIIRFGDYDDRRDDTDLDFDGPGAEGYVSPFGLNEARSGVFPGFDTGSSDGVVYLDDQAGTAGRSVTRLRSNVTDVEEERLDRQPIGASGTQVTRIGTAKIIRIAAEPGDAAAAGTPTIAKRTGLAPWSDGWKRYCSRAHSSFDPGRGTYVDADGDTRFCTGD